MPSSASTKNCDTAVARCLFVSFFFFNDTATTEIYTLSLHDALPISRAVGTDEPDDGAARDEEVDLVQGDDATETLGHAPYVQDGRRRGDAALRALAQPGRDRVDTRRRRNLQAVLDVGGGDRRRAHPAPHEALGPKQHHEDEPEAEEEPPPEREVRSEEHTSELQSRLHLVCRLLLEKKKKKDSRELGNQLDKRSLVRE